MSQPPPSWPPIPPPARDPSGWEPPGSDPPTEATPGWVPVPPTPAVPPQPSYEPTPPPPPEPQPTYPPIPAYPPPASGAPQYPAPPYQPAAYQPPPQYQAAQYQAAQYQPPGYPPPAYPPEYLTTPPYGQTYTPQYQYPPQSMYPPPSPPKTNGLAVTALILGIFGVCSIAAVVGLVLGIIGLSQIRKTGQPGKGLAVAGIVLSLLWLVGDAALIAYNITRGISASGISAASEQTQNRPPVGASPRTSGPAPSPAAGGPQFVYRLQPGDCIADYYDPNVPSLRVTVVSCGTPHRGEAFARFDLTGTNYPGDLAADQQSHAGCVDRFMSYAPKSVGDSSLTIVANPPSELSWKDNDKGVVCMVFDKYRTRTGSLRG